MLKLLSNYSIQFVSKIILGGTFVFASIGKIFHPSEFAEIIYSYKLAPDYSIDIIAIILPLVEFTFGIFLFLGIYPRISAITLSVLLIIFIAAISINVIRGFDFNCGCFSLKSNGSHSSGLFLLLRDLFLLILGIIIIFFDKRKTLSRFGSIRFYM